MTNATQERATLDDLAKVLEDKILSPIKEGFASMKQEPDPDTMTIPKLEADQIVDGLDKDGTPLIKTRDEAREEALMAQFKANMGQGLLTAIERPINQVSPAGIQLGSIAVGGAMGLFVGELVDGFVNPIGTGGGVNPVNLFAKAGAILVLNQAGGGLMSRPAVVASTVVLGVQMIRDILPIDRWVDQVLGLFGVGGTTQAMRQIDSTARTAWASQGPALAGVGTDILRNVR